MAGPGGRTPMMVNGGGARGVVGGSHMPMMQLQHQATAPIPIGSAPSWKEAKAPNGKTYWYIPGTTKTTWEKPDALRTDDELPPNWTRYTSVQGLPYFHNSVTNETTYTRPKATQKLDPKKVAARIKIPKTVWVLVRNGEGKVFFFNSETKKSQFRKPDELNNVALPELPSLDTGDAANNNKRSVPPAEDAANKRQRSVAPLGTTVGADARSAQHAATPAGDGDSDANDEEAMLLAAMEEEAELEREKQQEEPIQPGGVEAGGLRAGGPPPPVPGLFQLPPAFGAPAAGIPLQHAPPPMAPPIGLGMVAPTLHAPFPALPPPSVRSLEQRHEAKFFQMLHERKVDALTSWDHELPRIQNDYRFEKVTSAKKRRELFDQYQATLVQDVAVVTKRKKDADKAAFRELLESANIRPKTDFRTFRAKYAKDPRFKRIAKVKDQQALFLEFQRNIGKVSKKVAVTADGAKTTKEAIMQDFFAMLFEARFLERARWYQVQHQVMRDPRCIAVEDDERRDIYFTAFQQCPKDFAPATVQQRARIVEQLVVESSQRRREMEVRHTTEATEWALGREREQYVRTDQCTRFEGMLVDYVRTVDCTWGDVARDLQHDRRWSLVNALSNHEKEDLFARYVGTLKDKRRAAFRSMLDANEDITMATSWDDARAVVCTDARFLNLSDSDSVRETEYKSYIEMRTERAKREFRELCNETRVISHKSQELIEDEDTGHIHSDEINHALSNDKRYLEMTSLPEERDKILTEYILELHKKGPPPPPTASNRDTSWR